jgi:hypothetical protein
MAKVTELNTFKNTIPGAADALESLAKLAREGKLRCAVVVALQHDEEDTHTLYFSEGTTLEQIWCLGALQHAQAALSNRMVEEKA